jgi:hypothetical protein
VVSPGQSVLRVLELPAELVKTPVPDLPVELVKTPVSVLPVELVEMPVPDLPVGLVKMKEGWSGPGLGEREKIQAYDRHPPNDNQANSKKEYPDRKFQRKWQELERDRDGRIKLVEHKELGIVRTTKKRIYGKPTNLKKDVTSGDKNLKVSEIITSIDKLLDQDSSVKLKKVLSFRKKLSLEEKLTVIKTNNSPEEKKLEEKEKKKIEEMVEVDKAMKNKKPLMDGNRNSKRSCGARRDLQRSRGL